MRQHGLMALMIAVTALTRPLLAAGPTAPDGRADRCELPEVTIAPFGAIPPPGAPQGEARLQDSATTLDKAVNRKEVLGFLGLTLTRKQQQFLETHKFLVVPKRATKFRATVRFDGAEPAFWDEMLGMHDQVCGSEVPHERLPHNAHLVTPDIVLHVFHKYLANALKHLERTELAATLRRFVSGIRAQALACRRQAGGEAAARFEVLAAQFTVPHVLLENARWELPRDADPTGARAGEPDDKDTLAGAGQVLDRLKSDLAPELHRKVEEELKLVYAADRTAGSPLFGGYSKDGALQTDYTQFAPRSHYGGSSALRAYFRAMVFLGRNAWLFETDRGLGDALLLSRVMAGKTAEGQPILAEWKRVMEVTSFFAGPADDVGYRELRELVRKVAGKAELDPQEALRPETLQRFRSRLESLPLPRVLSEVVVTPAVTELTKQDLLAKTAGFRVLGQRFTFDAWALSRLTAGQEKGSTRLPSTPSAVFVPAVLGDSRARDLAAEFVKALRPPWTPAEVTAFLARLDEVASDLAKVKDQEWFASLGAAWLKVLGTLTATYGSGYPLYMRSPLFGYRQLEAFLGSFTELKHDTLLYAKQNYAEYGGGEEERKPPPCPRGFVEPNLRFFGELGRLIELCQSGIVAHKLIPSEAEEHGRIGRLKEAVSFYASLAAKELAGTPLTEAEYEKLRTLKLSDLAAPFEDVILEDKQLRSGLIADIHTDAVDRTVLYEATGEPHFMLALVGNEKAPRLTIGVVFNHYEFSEPLSKRLGDDDWRTRAYEKPGRLPRKGGWADQLRALR
ncbi:MAG: DUF3160 domain-containing protein [Candidatus Riflebacteria bacterium]|nr:DUF3160 domain-containing protein [Candidatus Riflebacteria bacterium]